MIEKIQKKTKKSEELTLIGIDERVSSIEQTPEYFKSQKIPENNTGPIKIIVTDTWWEQVTKSKKDILIVFYKPNNAKNKNIFDIFEKLRKIYKDEENLELAKIDMSLNEIIDVEIIKYPTLVLY